MIDFTYRVYGRPAAPGDAVWDQLLPMDRRGTSAICGTPAVAYGDYFQAARAFLAGNVGRAFPGQRIETVCIDLKKHGALYHPAKVTAAGCPQPLALNAALSEAGRTTLEQECRCLERLGKRGISAVPKVYARGEALTEDGRPVRLFLGEWFSGYHEFHISGDDEGRRRAVVWDEDRGNVFLTSKETAEVYRQAARILTELYDPETFEQVHPWRHGAGDFVVNIQGETVSVKLITVRGYGAAMAQPGEGDPAALLQGLLLFLLHLSIWNRLDRLDGVGEVVWADPLAVPATVAGFFDAMEKKPTPSVLPETWSTCFRAFLSVCSLADLTAVAESLADAYPDGLPETPVIRERLPAHVERLHGILTALI
jgi:hypothetical protein